MEVQNCEVKGDNLGLGMQKFSRTLIQKDFHGKVAILDLENPVIILIYICIFCFNLPVPVGVYTDHLNLANRSVLHNQKLICLQVTE